MHKGLFASLVLVISLSTVASALISQNQLMNLGAVNGVLIGGSGFDSATSTNLISGTNIQQTSSANDRVQVFQYEDGTLFQSAFAAGLGGTFAVDQVGNSVGAQSQTHDGGLGQGDQDQYQGADLYQGLAANGGDGYVGAVDGYVGHQVQVSLSPTGMSMNITKLDIVETGAIRRKP